MKGAAMAQTDDPTISTEAAVVLYENDATARAIEDIRNGRALAFITIESTDAATRLNILDLITNSEAIREHLKELFFIENIIIQRVEMADQQTGEMVTQPRFVFQAHRDEPDGEEIALHAISQGLMRSVNNMLGVLPKPVEWGVDGRPPAAFMLAGTAGRQYLTMRFGLGAYKLAGKPVKTAK